MTNPKTTSSSPLNRTTADGPQVLRVLVLHGPNLNLLGEREPAIYGSTSLAEIDAALVAAGREEGAELHCSQSNHEGALIDAIHQRRKWADGLLINGGGYAHTSVALADAIAAVELPAVEVHLSNTAAREPQRHASHLTPVCLGLVAGFGARGYLIALRGLLDHLRQQGAVA